MMIYPLPLTARHCCSHACQLERQTKSTTFRSRTCAHRWFQQEAEAELKPKKYCSSLEWGSSLAVLTTLSSRRWPCSLLSTFGSQVRGRPKSKDSSSNLRILTP